MKYYGGIDLGGTNTKIGLVDEMGTIVFKTTIKTSSEEGVDNTVKRISDVLKHELEVHEISLDDVNAVGIGIPGPVVNKKTVKLFANFSWEPNINFAEKFGNCIGKPVFLDNDVNVITLGEVWTGAAKKYKSVLGIAIGTGIGGGLVVDGKIVSGKIGGAGEVGHIKVVKDGLLCGCGQKGCLEAYASATGFERETESRLRVYRSSSLNEIKKVRDIEAKDVFDAAKAGDKLALEVVEDITDLLAFGISNMLNLLDPELVVIGGGVALAGEFLFNKIQSKLPKYTLGPILEGLEIKEAILGNDAGIYGAAYLSMLELESERD